MRISKDLISTIYAKWAALSKSLYNGVIFTIKMNNTVILLIQCIGRLPLTHLFHRPSSKKMGEDF